MEATVGPRLSRRQVLAAAGLAGLVAAVPGLRRIALPSPFGERLADWDADVGDDLTLGRFAPYVGSRFLVTTAGADGAALVLDEATAWAPHPADRPGLRGDAFSLTFQAQGQAQFGDGMHALVHPALGAFTLFLVAVGRQGSVQDYQAVVDRRLPPH